MQDSRSNIAHANGYNPFKNPHQTWEHQPYPAWVKTKDGKSVIANSKQEEDEILGRKPEPAKVATVDVAVLAQPEAIKEKRKYTKRAAAAPLPANLE